MLILFYLKRDSFDLGFLVNLDVALRSLVEFLAVFKEIHRLIQGRLIISRFINRCLSLINLLLFSSGLR